MKMLNHINFLISDRLLADGLDPTGGNNSGGLGDINNVTITPTKPNEVGDSPNQILNNIAYGAFFVCIAVVMIGATWLGVDKLKGNRTEHLGAILWSIGGATIIGSAIPITMAFVHK